MNFLLCEFQLSSLYHFSVTMQHLFLWGIPFEIDYHDHLNLLMKYISYIIGVIISFWFFFNSSMALTIHSSTPTCPTQLAFFWVVQIPFIWIILLLFSSFIKIFFSWFQWSSWQFHVCSSTFNIILFNDLHLVFKMTTSWTFTCL